MLKTEGYVAVGDDRLFYRLMHQQDDAPWLLFMHEALGSIRQWHHFPEQMAQRLRANILLYDRVGHGNSSTETTARATDFHHREVERLPLILQQLNIQHYYAVGHSDGGIIALLAAAAQLSGLHAGVCISAMSERSPKLAAIVQHVINDDSFTRTRQRLHKYHGDKTTQLVDNWVRTWGVTELPSLGMLSRLHNITVPTLIVHGGDDPFGGTEQVDAILAHIGGAESYIVPNLQHHPHLEDGDEVANAVADFLQRQGVR